MEYDFRDSNVGLKNHCIPKIDIKKFNGKDPATWILQMEQYFDLQDVQPSQKVHIVYLEPNQFAWYRWNFFLVNHLLPGQFYRGNDITL